MKGTVIILPTVRREDEPGRTQVHISLSDRDFRRLTALATAWGVEPRQAAQDLLREAITDYSRPPGKRGRQ